MVETVNDEAKSPKRRIPRWLVTAVRWMIFVAVLAGIAHTMWSSYGDFREQDFSLAEIDWRWFVAAGALYLVGLAPAWLYWHLVLRALGQRPGLWETCRAYYVSQLGKYVPGKAMVVVIRAGMVASPRVGGGVAAAAVFVETLTMMAVGAAVAAVLIALLYHEQTWLLLLSLALLVCSVVPTIPPVFRFLVRLMRIDRLRPELSQALAGLNLRLMGAGWLLMLLLWSLQGLSLLAALAAMPGVTIGLADLTQAWPLATCCVALATVAGFVSMIPGGLAVRELVLITLLAPVYGEPAAIVSAILLRLAGLLSELLISTILYFVRGKGVSGEW